MSSPKSTSLRARKWVLVVVLLLVVAVVLALIHYLPTTVAPGGKDRVSVRLKWITQAQFAGVYAAKEQGFYAQDGIDCTIRPGGQDLNAVKLVAAGSDDFGVWGAPELIVARSKGIPVVAVAVIFRKSPACFIAKQSSGIKGPKDFEGRKVGVQIGTSVAIEYEAMLRKVGVDRSKITEIPVQFDVASFFLDKVEVWPSYVINEPLMAAERGVPINIISASDYGVHVYADVIFTTEKMIREKPDLVRRFLAATIRGWEWAIRNPDRAADCVLKYDETLKKEHELAMLKAATPLVLVGKTPVESRIGWMTREGWEEVQGVLLEQKIIESRVDVDTVFTMRFLQEIYK